MKKRVWAVLILIVMVFSIIPSIVYAEDGDGATSASDAPAFAKNLYDNGDGTYTLSLSVTGVSETTSSEKPNRANVILVLDTSSSMNTSAGNTYYDVPGTPTYSSDGVTPTYYRKEGDNYLQLYWRNDQWRETNSTNGPVYTGTFYSTSRFWAEYHALTDDGGIVDSLLAQNTTLYPDIIEIGIASFGGAGAKKLDFSGTSNTNAAAIKGIISGLSTSQGTNWEEGLMQAHAIYDTLTADEKAEEKTYVIFLTDGEPTTWNNHYSVSNRDDAFDEAKDNAHTLVDTDKAEFYGVFTWGTQTYYTYLQSLVGYAYTGTGGSGDGAQGHGDHVYNATSTKELTDALKQIADTIRNNVGFTDTGLHDGVTSMTSSSAKTTANGDVTGLKYYRSGGEYGTADPKNGKYGTEWTDAPKATVGSDGVVDWELGENFDLENGVTYTVTFVVWPKQESLDLVADLNNGVKTYDSLTDEQKAQIKNTGGKYVLKTNTDYPSVSYKTYTQQLDAEGKPKEGTRVESTLKTSEIENPDPVALTEEKLNALKEWEDSMDESQREEVGDSVTLYLMVDGDYYYRDPETNEPLGVTLTKDSNWTETDYLAIAPGIMVTEDSPAYDPDAPQVVWDGVTYAILEKGHDYVWEESDINYHFELTAYHHHPMIMGHDADGNPVTKDVIFNEDGTIKDVLDMTDSLSATNTLKGGINITKQIVDENGEAIETKDPFTVKVTLTDSDGEKLPDKTSADGTKFNIDYRVYYGTNNPAYETSGEKHRSDHIYVSGTEFTETLYVGDTIRVVNVESGAVYTVTEPSVSKGYEFVETSYEIAYAGKDSNRDDDPDHMVQGNSASYATVTNKYTYGSLEVSKSVNAPKGVTVDTEFEFTFKLFSDNTKATELSGLRYDYVLTSASGSESDGTVTEGSTFKLKNGDKITIDKLPEGSYYEVTESAASGFTTTSKGTAGEIVKNETQTAEFTNTLDTATLILKKTVLGLGAGESVPESTTFTVTCKPVAGSFTIDPVKYSDFNENNEYTMTVPVGEYSVTESGADVTGYTLKTEYSNEVQLAKGKEGTLTVTNTYTRTMTDITVTKVWEDDSNKYGVRPDSVKFTVTGSDKATYDVTLKGTGNTWTATLSVPEYTSGVKNTYTVDEEKVTAGYVKSVKDLTITNTFKPCWGDPPVKKVVEGDEPSATDTFTFKLTAVSTTAEGLSGKMPMPEAAKGAQEMTMDVKAGESKEFGKFDLVKPGVYTYTITEVAGDKEGYTYSTEKHTVVYTVTTNDDNSLKCVKTVDGAEIDAEKETAEENVSKFTFTNKYVKPVISFKVSKVWDDGDNAELTRPDSIKVTLYADGKDTGKTIELSKDTEWAGVFEDLDKYDADGKEIKYTVEEAEVPEGYSEVVSGDTAKGFVITNSIVPPTGDTSDIFFWSGLSMTSLLGLGYLFIKRRKEEQ